jgi:hypothetical protein
VSLSLACADASLGLELQAAIYGGACLFYYMWDAKSGFKVQQLNA